VRDPAAFDALHQDLSEVLSLAGLKINEMEPSGRRRGMAAIELPVPRNSSGSAGLRCSSTSPDARMLDSTCETELGARPSKPAI